MSGNIDPAHPFVERPEIPGAFMPPEEAIDPKTGLLNEAGVNMAVDHLIAVMPGGFALVEVDLDLLKDVNELDGHAGGDMYIRAAADILDAVTRQEDMFGYVGRRHGDEFAILLPGVHEQADVVTVIARLQAELESHGIGASMGGRPHKEGDTRDSLAKDADELATINDYERKLNSYTPQQLLAAIEIGRIAAENGISIRTVPTILNALRDTRVDSTSALLSAITHGLKGGKET